MKITKREKILMIVVAAVIAAVLYGWLVFLPESRMISSLDEEYNNCLLDKVKIKNSGTYLNNMNLKLQDIQKQIDNKTKAISQPIKVPDILTELYATADTEKIKLDAIELSDNAAVKGNGVITFSKDEAKTGQSGADQQKKQEQNNDKLKVLTVKLNLKGSYSGIMNFIGHYEVNSRLFIADSIKITGNKGGCIAEISLKTYSIAADRGNYSAGNSGVPKDPFTGVPEPDKKQQDTANTLPGGILLPGTKLPDGTTIPGMLYPYYPGVNLPGIVIPGTKDSIEDNTNSNSKPGSTTQGTTTGKDKTGKNDPDSQ